MFRSPPVVLAMLLTACGAAPAPVASARGGASAAPALPSTPQAAPTAAVPTEEGAAIPIFAANPTWGSRLALVTLVEYSDFQCPYCARVEPTLERLRHEYGPERLRIVWKNNPLPFHANAKPAAEAAAGVFTLAGNDAFWKFHDAAFKNQEGLGRAAFEDWGREAGVRDASAFKAGLESHLWADAVERDVNEGRSVGVTGTPIFFANGVLINGAQPFDRFKEVIDAELERARTKIAEGTPQAAVYAEMARENRKTVPPPDGEDDEKDDSATVYRVPLGRSPARGSSRALVTIVEFSDFQCPFCSRVEPTLSSLRTKYGDKLRLVWKNEPLPFHPAAEPAAEAALEVRTQKGDAAFWTLHDALLADQKSLIGAEGPNLDAIVAAAVRVGADGERVRKAMATHAHKSEIDADADLAEDVAAAGTPHFFINGRRLVGAQPQERFEAVIEEEIPKAERLRASGDASASADVYSVLIRDGQGPSAPETKPVPSAAPRTDPWRGNGSAKVTIHEWADFQCPYCGHVEPTLAALLKEYGGRVRFVWHDMPLPFHEHALLAAEAAREAFAQKGAAGFWAMHEKLFANQSKLERTDLDAYAAELRLDMAKWNGALDAESHRAEVEASSKAGDDAELSGTPAFLVVAAGAPRAYFVNGAQPYRKFRRVIERALSEAK